MPETHSLVVRYGIAMAGVVAAGVVRWLLDPVLGDQLPFATFFVAVLAAARYAGLTPSLAALVLGGLVGTYFFVPPRNAFGFGDSPALLVLGLYFVVGGVFILFSHALESARRRAEESEERFRQLAENVREVFWMSDLAKSEVLYVSPAYEAVWGRSCESLYADPRSFFEAIHPEDRDLVRAASLEKQGRGEAAEVEYRVVRPDGSVRWVRDRSFPVRDEAGEAHRMVGVVEDVTDRRNADFDLKLQARILESMSEGVSLADEQGVILYTNPAEDRIFGYGPGELVGKQVTVQNAYAPEENERVVAEVIEQLKAKGVWAGEWRNRRKDGTPFTTFARITALDAGGKKHWVCVQADVTEQKKAEASLRESEERFRLMADAIPQIIWITDADGRTEFFNRQWEAYTGAPFEPTTAGDVAARFVHPDDGPPTLAAFEEARRAGTTFRVEHRIRSAAGEYRWFLVRAEPHHDPATGAVVRWYGTSTDVHDAKAAEQALRESDERFRAIADHSITGIAEVDLTGRLVFVNDRYCKMLGRPREELLGGMRMQDVTHPDDLPRNLPLFERLVREGEPFVVEKRYVRRGGAAVWVNNSVSGVRGPDGAVRSVVAISVDVTDRKRAEATAGFLADASATLAALVDYQSTLQKVAKLAVPSFADWCCVDMLDEGGDLRRLAVAHTDPQKVELAHDLHRRHPPERDAARGVWKVIRTGESELATEVTDDLLQATTKDPERLWKLRELGLSSYMGVPLAVRGKVLGVLSFFTAESARRYTADDLAVAEDLARRASVAVENARLYQEVREADRKKDEFLAVLAHELRNPLAPVRNALEIMKLAGPAAGPAGHAREIAERQVQQLTRLVDDLLEVGRIVQGKLELRRERLDLALVLARAVETVRPLIEAEAHDLVVTLPDRPVWIDGDLVRLAQVVSNLLGNAARYTERGGRLQLAAGVDEGRAVVRVADNGIGIPPEMLPRIFDMFMQVASTEARPKIGLGIGLTLAKNLVELHGGTIEARSDGPGQGSEFVVRLPLASAESRPRSEADDGGSSRRQGAARRKVLVVDDNVDAAESLAMLLQMQGHEVLVAYDGVQALELVQTGAPPQTAFLDIGMPVMDGYELARRFRSDPMLKGVFLVALTGWGQEEDRRRTREAGFDRHLVKPVEPEALADVLAAP